MSRLMNKMLTRVWPAALALVLCVWTAAPALACPNCKEAVASGTGPGAGDPVAAGYYWSILLMLSMPLLLGSGVAGRVSPRYGRPASAADPPATEPTAGVQATAGLHPPGGPS